MSADSKFACRRPTVWLCKLLVARWLQGWGVGRHLYSRESADGACLHVVDGQLVTKVGRRPTVSHKAVS